MKKLFLILALIFAVNVSAQSDSIHVHALGMKTPGDYLIQSSNRYAGGCALILFGTTFSSISTILPGSASSPVMIGGIAMSLIGVGVKIKI